MLGWMGEENIKGQKARDKKTKMIDRYLKGSFFVFSRNLHSPHTNIYSMKTNTCKYI